MDRHAVVNRTHTLSRRPSVNHTGLMTIWMGVGASVESLGAGERCNVGQHESSPNWQDDRTRYRGLVSRSFLTDNPCDRSVQFGLIRALDPRRKKTAALERANCCRYLEHMFVLVFSFCASLSPKFSHLVQINRLAWEQVLTRSQP